MKLGYNAVTDEAREKLEQLGVATQFVHSGTSQTFEVFTENYDSEKEEWRTKPWDWLPWIDTKGKRYQFDGFRVWKHPDTGVYYLWIKETVFRKYTIEKVDYRFSSPTNPATVNVIEVLDYDPQDDSFRDKLLSIRPMAESGFFQ
jgi:hypothetical protein